MTRLHLLLGPLLLATSAQAQSVVVLDQPPNQVNVTYSDEDCDACGGLGTGQQSIAENFTVTVDPGSPFFTLEEIVLWGGHNDTPPAADLFTINIYDDVAGFPSALLHSEGDVPHTAIPTGGSVFSTTEVEYTFALAHPPQLASGTYWLEIFNYTAGSPSTWGVEKGDLDTWAGIDGFVFSEYCPGTNWWSDNYTAGSPSRNFAMRISGSGAVATGAIQPLCYGQSCPCGNDDGAGGCMNSTGVGAHLGFGGTASVGAGDLALVGTKLIPGKTALLFSGSSALGGGGGLLFGDGLRCVGHGVRRIGIAVPDTSGTASWTGNFAATQGWAAGDTTYL